MLALDPARTVLLLMDFQSGIVGMFGAAGAGLVDNAVAARAAARKAGMAVMYIRVALTGEDAAAIPAHNRTFAAIAASGRLDDAGPATAIVPELAPAADEEVFRKRRVGAFSTTELGARLKARNMDTLVLAGLSTSGVVLSTLRDAADKDLRVFILGDCCADPDPEVHRILLDKVFPRQAEVVSLADFTGGR